MPYRDKDQYAAYQAAYQRANRDKIAEQKKGYQERNREKLNAAARKRYDRDKEAERKRRYYAENPDAVRRRNRAWKAENAEKTAKSNRVWHLKNTFGITEDDYAEMLAAQNGVCKICKGPPQRKYLAIDHCHATGKIRGLLCKKCNVGLGSLGDTAERVSKALAYLEEFESSARD